MGLIRLLSWLVVGYFLWAFLRNYLRKQQNLRNSHAKNQPQGAALIVKCSQCGLHLPEAEATTSNQQWFCGDDHRRQWTEQRERQR